MSITDLNVELLEPMDLIDGERQQPALRLGRTLHDPNSAEPIQEMRASSPEAVEKALAAAQRVYQAGDWSGLSPEERAAWMEKIAAAAEAHLEEIARLDAYTTGAIIRFTRMVAMIVKIAFIAAAGQARSGWQQGTMGPVEVLRPPWGPAALIVPWNAPSGLAAHKIANALAAGCPAILKPSEFAPHSVNVIAEIIAAAGLPSGVFQLLHGAGEVGAQLVSDPRIRAVSFTGGLQGGRAVAAACAPDFKPAQLELGGNNALIAFEDADLDAVAQGVVNGLTTLNGQWCRALGRLLLHESIAGAALERALEALAEVKIGHSLAEDSDMGPLIHAGHLKAVSGAAQALAARGGTLHRSTPLPADLGGYFHAPTLITGCDPADTLEEIFGPVAAVHSFRTEAEAVALANQPPYGLGGYVFGADAERALRVARQMHTGEVKINGVQLMSINPMAPRPAWGLSGMGEEGTAETFRFFCGTRVVGIVKPG